MRHVMLGLAAVVALSFLAPAAQAQVAGGFSSGFSDPFFLYYGFYLPRQQYLAAQPSTPNMLNEVAAARQGAVMADRQGLYDAPVSPFSPDLIDPLSPFSPKRTTPLPRLPMHFVRPRAHNGLPPVQAYNRTARYFPSIVSSSHPNRNTPSIRSARGGSGGFGGFGGYGGGMSVPSSVPSR